MRVVLVVASQNDKVFCNEIPSTFRKCCFSGEFFLSKGSSLIELHFTGAFCSVGFIPLGDEVSHPGSSSSPIAIFGYYLNLVIGD